MHVYVCVCRLLLAYCPGCCLTLQLTRFDCRDSLAALRAGRLTLNAILIVVIVFVVLYSLREQLASLWLLAGWFSPCRYVCVCLAVYA